MTDNNNKEVAQTESAPVEQPKDQEQDVQQTQESFLDQLVGEGKKFSDVEQLAKGKIHADEHAKKLESENETLRSTILEQTEKMDKYLEYLEKQTKTPTKVDSTTESAVSESNTINSVGDSNNIEDVIRQTVSSVLSKERQEVELNKTKETLSKRLSDTYGNIDEANRVISQLKEEKPYMKDILNQYALHDPDKLISELTNYKKPKANQAENPLGDISPVVHTDDFDFVSKEEWKEVFHKNPKEYNTPEFQARLEKSKAACREKGIDWHKTKK